IWSANDVTYTSAQVGLTIAGTNCEGDQVLNLTVTDQPVQPTIACYETATFNAVICSWEVTGTQPIQPTLECWETATFNNTTCLWDVFGTQPGTVIEDHLVLCDGNTIIVRAQTSILNPSYVWSTGEITEEIIVDTPGVYTVDINGGVCSSETRIYNVIGTEAPIIETVESNGNEISITTANSGDFLYSLDGLIFQSSNIFFDVDGGLYTIYVKDPYCNITVTSQYLHFYIPKFFSPNNDGINDTFNLSGLENYGTSQVSIFNRYGKLLKFVQNASFTWDGTYNNSMLPSDDYWYLIIIEEQKFAGHFALKR
ncbi:MAG: T9SS type B sorting domain-containing protein, partial [Maribacter sp.]|nr:T9SS type B sorting domain-containing protein [Maribacter sp.]